MRRISIIAIGTLLAVTALAGTALAKGGAITKLDGLPPGGLHAGQTYSIGYTILMDGVEPYKADTTEILIRNGSGKALSYPGIADGKPGHYVAKVYFPISGTWTWQVTQGSYFPPMDLGTINVQMAVAGSASQSAPATAQVDQLGQAAPFLAALVALAAALGAWRVVRTQRRISAAA